MVPPCLLRCHGEVRTQCGCSMPRAGGIILLTLARSLAAGQPHARPHDDVPQGLHLMQGKIASDMPVIAGLLLPGSSPSRSSTRAWFSRGSTQFSSSRWSARSPWSCRSTRTWSTWASSDAGLFYTALGPRPSLGAPRFPPRGLLDRRVSHRFGAWRGALRGPRATRAFSSRRSTRSRRTSDKDTVLLSVLDAGLFFLVAR